MAEENKEIKTESNPSNATEDTVKTTPKEGVKDQPAGKAEVPANCMGCNKSIKKKRWYYRNNKFYCTKRCWKNSTKENKAPQEETPKSAS